MFDDARPQEGLGVWLVCFRFFFGRLGFGVFGVLGCLGRLVILIIFYTFSTVRAL